MFFKAVLNKPHFQDRSLFTNLSLVLVILTTVICTGYIALSTLKTAVENYSEVPYTDQWTLLPFVRDALNGHFDLHKLFAQQNEHRIAFMRVVFLLDAWVFGGMEYVPLILNWIFMAGTAYILISFISFNKNYNFHVRVWTICVAVACLFSKTQIEVITFPTGSMNLGVFFFALASLKILSQVDDDLTYRSWALFVLSLAAMLLCESCAANGVFIWPTAFLFLLLTAARKIYTWLVGVIGTLAVAAYMNGYRTPSYHSNPLESLKHPFDVINYLLANFGSPFAYLGLPLSSCAGLALFALICYNLFQYIKDNNRRCRIRSVLICFCLFLSVTCVLTALGRLRFGVAQAQASRYCTPVLILWATSWLLWASIWLDRKMINPVSSLRALRGRSALDALPALLFVSALSIVQPAGDWISATTEKLRQAGILLSLGDFDLPTDLSGGAGTAVVKEGAEFLRQRHLSVFKSRQQLHLGQQLTSAFEVLSSKGCAGAVDGVEQTDFGVDVQRVRGWAWDGRQRKVPDVILFVADGVISGWASAGIARPDVTQAIPSINSQYTGFSGFVRRGEGQQMKSFILDSEAGGVCPL